VPQALLGAVLHCVVEAQGGMSFAGTTRSIFRFDPSPLDRVTSQPTTVWARMKC
jgi:hypothetical protein